jgi:hypothetical protein
MSAAAAVSAESGHRGPRMWGLTEQSAVLAQAIQTLIPVGHSDQKERRLSDLRYGARW